MIEDETNFGVFANSLGCKIFRPTALLLLIGQVNGADTRMMVVGMSRGGRHISVYRDVARLSNFRVKYIPHRFLRKDVDAVSRGEAARRLATMAARIENDV